MEDDFRALEAELGHDFADPTLLRRALTHKSRAFEDGKGSASTDAHNEQLEFLGDAVLGFFVSEELVRRFPSLPEGRLSKLKARLVSAGHLSDVATQLNLGTHLLLGKGEESSGGREKKALLANCLEAVIAAIHLDAGMERAKAFVVTRIVSDFASTGVETIPDFKSGLQEAAQARNLPLPEYRTVDSSGPDHAAVFTVEVQVGDRWRARGRGNSKKTAGQRAAQALLQHLDTPAGKS